MARPFSSAARSGRYASSLAYPRSTRHTRTYKSSSDYFSGSILLTVVLCVASFFAGSLYTLSASASVHSFASSSSSAACDHNSVQESMKNALSNVKQVLSSSASGRFPETMSRFASGLSRISKQDFASTIDTGVPMEATTEGDEEVLVIYNQESTFPDRHAAQVFGNGESTDIPLLNTTEALQNCEHVHVLLTDRSGHRKQCLAIVPQYESYHIQNWMRAPEAGGAVTSDSPLRFVSRGYQSNGRQQFQPPQMKHVQKFWEMLETYIREMPNTMSILKPLAEKVAKDNTVVVMVVNFGQSELLLNFACSARAQGLDTSQVLVFVTDQESKDLAEGLGLTAFYDKTNFGDMPTDAAKRYGDKKFTAMMMAKVFCVQMISMLGYNILFQDVDVVWFRNPLEYFQDTSAIGDFDMYFQDDGAHSQRYAPLSANTGFYYVRNNEKTQYFFTSLLHAGDMILKFDSHQQALIAMLNEHASLFGLKVKVLSRDTDDFPGGYHYHQKSGNYMRAFFKGDVSPQIFHMSWTENKNNKLLFLKQSGMWYLQEQCIAKKAAEIQTSSTDLATQCCSAEPLISCHYRDKPSIKPCKDSPPIDKGKPSFW